MAQFFNNFDDVDEFWERGKEKKEICPVSVFGVVEWEVQGRFRWPETRWRPWIRNRHLVDFLSFFLGISTAFWSFHPGPVFGFWRPRQTRGKKIWRPRQTWGKTIWRPQLIWGSEILRPWQFKRHFSQNTRNMASCRQKKPIFYRI